MKEVFSFAIIWACTLMVPSISHAQKTGADSVIFFSKSQTDSIFNGKASTERALAFLLGSSQDKEAYLVILRTKPGDVEIHEQFDDVAIVRSGYAMLKTGNKVSGHKESGSPGAREWAGGMIEDGKERSLSPGDFVVIPAMLAHQYIPKAGEPFTYWTIKVRRTKPSNRK
ncbi:MAG TPA: hypothetical protein VF141_19275 [Chryseolinea sp.]